ncbi:MAG TPA: hypothetical protein VH682_30650 [Gemmataceae bacterium]|jgi:hypothetical protein
MAAVVMLAGAANRAEAQFGFGTVRFGGVGVTSFGGPFGGVTSVRGPFGGRVTAVQGPFGGGAVSVRGPFGGGVGVVAPGIAPVVPFPVAPVVPVPVPVPVVQQTVLNPAVAPAFTYSPGYLARIPPGYPFLEIAATPYYYTPVLPPGSQPVTVGGVDLFASNGVFYQPYFLGARTVYLVVER